MADLELTAIYTANPVALDAGDLGYTVENTGTTPADGAFKYSQLMTNRYKLVPSVAGNNLTLALKHLDGTDPSVDRPLYFKIGNSLRICTAALSVTKNAGTNWCSLGAAETATLENDLFAYVIWNTNLAGGTLDIFWSRIPYGMLYSEFNSTSTAYKYGAINSTAPAATDECVNIGRFAATLSGGAGYTWTVPTYTNINLKHVPTFDTRVTTCATTITGTSAYACTVTYQIVNKQMYYSHVATAAGTGSTTGFTVTMPFNAAGLVTNLFLGIDNSAYGFNTYFTTSGSNVVTLCKGAGITAASWTASGNRLAYLSFWVPIG